MCDIKKCSKAQKEKMSRAFAKFMDAMGLDLSDQSLRDTPMREAKMFGYETCRGLYEDPPKITTFPNDQKYPGIVLIRDITVESLCEHHFQPFIGKCHIGYIPQDKVVGLSKFSRVVDHFARRPQVQERLTKQIYDFLVEILGTENIAIVINSTHYCMKIRGVQEHNSSTTTSMMGGIFMHGEKARDEFYNLLRMPGQNY